MINNYKELSELPIMLTPMDVASVLGISKNNAYCVVRSEGFPCIRIGKQYRIPKQDFINWLNSIKEISMPN